MNLATEEITTEATYFILKFVSLVCDLYISIAFLKTKTKTKLASHINGKK